MVYKNGGILAKTERWTYGGVALEVVPCFTYLGLNFTRQLSLTQMACKQAVKEKRILISILSKLYIHGQLSSEVFFKIFDTKISSVLLYGAEIWGLNINLLEKKFTTMNANAICALGWTLPMTQYLVNVVGFHYTFNIINVA